jgi:hypothetical protein
MSLSSRSSALIRWNCDVCFVRARADTYVVATDFTNDAWTEGETRDGTTQKGIEVLEDIVVGHKCSYYVEVHGESETTVLAGCRADQDWYLTQNASRKIILLDKEQVNVIPNTVWMGGGGGDFR